MNVRAPATYRLRTPSARRWMPRDIVSVQVDGVVEMNPDIVIAVHISELYIPTDSLTRFNRSTNEVDVLSHAQR